jgi:cysteine synthase A
MGKIYSNVTELIGRTPLVELSNYAKANGARARIVAKLERMNPGGSIKDRAAMSMIRAAEESGKLEKSGMIIEPTSGNTGIGLSSAAAVLGYKAVIVMPDSMSVERRKLIAAYGAEIVLTRGRKAWRGLLRSLRRFRKTIPAA